MLKMGKAEWFSELSKGNRRVLRKAFSIHMFCTIYFLSHHCWLPRRTCVRGSFHLFNQPCSIPWIHNPVFVTLQNEPGRRLRADQKGDNFCFTEISWKLAVMGENTELHDGLILPATLFKRRATKSLSAPATLPKNFTGKQNCTAYLLTEKWVALLWTGYASYIHWTPKRLNEGMIFITDLHSITCDLS